MNSESSRPRSRARKLATAGAVTLALATLLFVLLEGIASTATFVWELATTGEIAERLHTRHDPDLGWVNLRNLDEPDFYGPGQHFRTNSLGFRNDTEFGVEQPEGKLRIVCSGDSFTLGYGVANEHTWCQQLTELDRRLETVNMGQGGYGVGQAYMWYLRDGAQLDHSVHILAFITEDFERMKRDRFMGYEKPLLRLVDGELVVTNVPVPEPSRFTNWAARRVPAVRRLRLIQLARSVAGRPTIGDAAGPDGVEAGSASQHEQDAATRAVMDRLVEELRELNREKGSALALVHIPIWDELDGHPAPSAAYARWRDYLTATAARLGVLYVDLGQELSIVPAEERRGLYFTASVAGYWGGEGHLTVDGNRVVARALYGQLIEVPAIRERLDALSPDSE